MPNEQKNIAISRISLILGILVLVFVLATGRSGIVFYVTTLGSLLAVIFGVVGLKKSNDPRYRQLAKAGIIVASVCLVLYFAYFGLWIYSLSLVLP